jgi:hypothetical protein
MAQTDDEFEAAQRSMQARAAVYSSWARTPDRSARTAAAREALMGKFEAQVDPNGTLPPHERAQRAEAARRSYFQDLARESAKVRRRRARGE